MINLCSSLAGFTLATSVDLIPADISLFLCATPYFIYAGQFDPHELVNS
jgi:hypothetical protein